MGVRDHFPDPQGHRGVETVLFNSTGFQIGKVGPDNFEQQFARIRDTVYRGTILHLIIIHENEILKGACDFQAVGHKS
jgi:hypothetical protein